MTATAYDTLQKLIKKYCNRAPRHDLEELYKDLGLAGDDVDEFLEEFSKTFGVEVSDFDFHRYFPDETEACGDHWARMLGFKTTPRAPITVRHLVEVIETGKWTNP